MTTPPDLSQKICLVAGASRGVGRGLARALGEAGATVIVTARSSRKGTQENAASVSFLLGLSHERVTCG